MSWFQGSLFTNPVAGTKILDTGPLNRTCYGLTLIASTNAGSSVELFLQLVAGDGTTIKKSKIVPVAFSLINEKFGPIEVKINESLQVINRNDVTGEVEVALILDPR